MSGTQIRMRVAVIAFLLMVRFTVTAEGATFNIVYDTSLNQQIGNIIGNGTFSYDGPATVGSFSFQSLTGIAFTAVFQVGFPISFSTADVLSLSSTNGITVFDAGNDQLGLVFTGSGVSFPFFGSLDAQNSGPPGSFLSHESTSSVDDRTGISGNGTINAYSFRSGTFFAFDGDYRALAVPEPASLTILGSGLVILLTLLCRTHQRASS